jgi:hypothetical protein
MEIAPMLEPDEKVHSVGVGHSRLPQCRCTVAQLRAAEAFARHRLHTLHTLPLVRPLIVLARDWTIASQRPHCSALVPVRSPSMRVADVVVPP